MLILQRKLGQRILIDGLHADDRVAITILKASPDRVSLEISAREGIKIQRMELQTSDGKRSLKLFDAT